MKQTGKNDSLDEKLMQINTETGHRWRFCRLGGFDQVRLETAEDIRHLGELDQKLWAALGCPVDGLEFDPRTLALLDSDKDGRIRVPEILAACSWVSQVLRDMEPFLAGSEELPMAAINESDAEGKQLIASAKQLLFFIGKANAESISVADVSTTDTLLYASKFNGDGIIAANVSEDIAIQKLITEIMSCVGSDEDRSGLPGISRDRLHTFFEAARKYADWRGQVKINSALLPFAEQTENAAEIFRRLKNKIDDYFLRCGLAAYDTKAEGPLNPSLVSYEAVATQDLGSPCDEILRFPLAHIEAGRPLPLKEGINPAWMEAVATFVDLVVSPLFDETEFLQPMQWQIIKETFAPYEEWQQKKTGLEVEHLGLERVEAILQGPGGQLLEDLIQQDLQLASQIDAFEKVERLVYFNRDLFKLLNNFVAFRDFYQQGRKAIFQAGTLYIDGRACELCIKVASVDSHIGLSALSRMYLAYCQCRRRGSDQQMFLAAAFTSGDSDNLMLGRNGVFYDCNGNDWDATIVKIIEHPISVSQAFWAPYKRLGRMIGEQIEKIAVAKDKAIENKTAAGVATAAAKTPAPAAPVPATPPAPVASPPPAPPLPFDVGKFAGIFAALGLAVGAIGTAVASILGVFAALPLWQMPLALAGLLLAISGPSMLIAYLKLRQRNLGPMLDASGWAVNIKARINIPFGSTLTKVATLPKGSERILHDPFAEKKVPWKRWVALVILIVALAFIWQKGYVQQWVKSYNKSTTETKVEAPAAQQPAPSTTKQKSGTK